MYAVFPLNVVILPNEKIALHLFEDRYRELFADHRNGKKFIILNEELNQSSNIGTIVHIDKVVHEYEDGKADIVVRGSQLIKVNEFIPNFPNKLYSAVRGESIDFLPNSSEVLMKEASSFFINKSTNYNLSDLRNPYKIAALIGIDDDIKKLLIQIHDQSQLNLFLLNELRTIQKALQQEHELQERFLLN